MDVIAVTELPIGSMIQHSLVMKTNVSNKYYNIYLHVEPSGTYVVYVHHGRIGSAGRFLKSYTSKRFNDAQDFATMQMKSKVGKGYVEASANEKTVGLMSQPKISLEKKETPQAPTKPPSFNRLSIIE